MRTQLIQAIAASLLAAGNATAQYGTISGIVTDWSTRQPIANVSVTYGNSYSATQTKTNGTYTLVNVPPGVYTVVARRIGYQTMEVTGVTVNADARRTQNFEMRAGPSSPVAGGPVVEPGVVGARPQTPPPGRTPPVPEPGVAMPAGVSIPRVDQIHAATPRPPEPGGVGVVPSFEHLLFPPELVMQHQRALELTADQRRTITEAVKALQSQTVDLQWNLQAEQQALMSMLDKRPINEAAAVQQMAKLVDLEDAVKRTHLATLIKIKNALTDKQVGILNSARHLRLEYPPPSDRRDPIHQLDRDQRY